MYGPMLGPMREWMVAMPWLGQTLMLGYVVIGIGGFVLIAWGGLTLTERFVASRDRALNDLRRRYAGGEIDEQEYEARRRRLAR